MAKVRNVNMSKNEMQQTDADVVCNYANPASNLEIVFKTAKKPQSDLVNADKERGNRRRAKTRANSRKEEGEAIYLPGQLSWNSPRKFKTTSRMPPLLYRNDSSPERQMQTAISF
ncbi:hypothetical protein V6Z92_005878 [Aspergillus fumigatus]